MAKNSQPISTHFIAALESALKEFNNPQWLGDNSVLASPYFLGNRSAAHLGNSTARGRTLQDLLQSAVAEIRGPNAKRYQAILTQRYFEKNTPVEVAMGKVGLGKNAFHKNRRAAIHALGATLVDLVHPSLRLETPPSVRNPFPRPFDMARLHAFLEDGKDVTILGPEGSGRSTLAAQLVRGLDRPVLWYTIRPGINDSVEAFAFALALFAYEQGNPLLWLELMAAQGKIRLDTLTELLNFALAQLESPPLLCIDDADALDTTNNPAHGALIRLLDSLAPLTTRIVIGRQMVLNTDQYLPMHTLSAAETQRFFAHCGVEIASDEVNRYHLWTQGNLRLLRLCCSILATEPEGAPILEPSNDAPTWNLLITNLLATLPDAEQRLLASLSVFRRPRPLDFLPDSAEMAACRSLQERQILEITADGSGEVANIYRQFVYHSLSPKAAQVLHSQAAELRSAYGEYSSTIYHLLHAQRFEEVIDLWPNVQRQEMEQGQAVAVLCVFRSALKNESLPDMIRGALLNFCAELERFLGNIDQAKIDIDSTAQSIPLFQIAELELKGKIDNDLGRFSEAEQAFGRALDRADILMESRLSQIHKGLAWMHLRQRDLDQVERELTHAQFEIENMRGNLVHDRSRYDEATEYYEEALRLADELGSLDAAAKTRLNLATVHMVRGRFGESIELLEEVFRHYETMARIAAMAGCRITMAVAYNLAGDHAQALICLNDADQKLSAVDEVAPWQIALIDQARAEALLGLGDLDAAAVHVQRAIDANDTALLPDAYRTYGEILTQQQNWVEAAYYLQRSIDAAAQNEDAWLHAYAWRALGKLHIARRQPAKARRALSEAIELFEGMNLRNETDDCAILLSTTPARISASEPGRHRIDSTAIDKTGGKASGTMKISRLSEEDVHDHLAWRYDNPYDIYNVDMDDIPNDVSFYLASDNGYFAVRDENNALIGFCCYGFEGQVPGGDYGLEALDIGIGMRPELTGQGIGYDFVGAVLDNAVKTYAPHRLRATIALFNRRSQRVFEKHGFSRQSQFLSATTHPREFVILVKEIGNVD